MSHLEKHITLKPKEERRFLGGHPWVFSNEVREIAGSPAAGDVVELLSAGGKSLGIGFYSPHSLIAFRLLSLRIEEIDTTFFRNRIADALALRQTLFPGNSTYRLVHGESDFLPGLLVDKFNEYVCVQTLSYGMDARLPSICDAIESLLQPAGVVERNESPLRELEHLPVRKGILRGSVQPTSITDGDLTFCVDVLRGQKTGFFLDQRENRYAVRRFSAGRAVLDCFCNDGGFALHAARAGASSVIGVDSSAEAVQRASENASRNGLTNVRFEHADVFEALQVYAAESRMFDTIILDPPSFTKSRKHVQSAKQGYRELHGLALRLLKPQGFLLTASCSHHIEQEVFLEILDGAARKAGRSVQLLEWRGAASDHPVLPAVPETRYLKFAVTRIL